MSKQSPQQRQLKQVILIQLREAVSNFIEERIDASNTRLYNTLDVLGIKHCRIGGQDVLGEEGIPDRLDSAIRETAKGVLLSIRVRDELVEDLNQIWAATDQDATLVSVNPELAADIVAISEALESGVTISDESPSVMSLHVLAGLLKSKGATDA